MRRIEVDPWDTDAWTGLVKEAGDNRGGGMSHKDVLRWVRVRVVNVSQFLRVET